MSWWDEVVTDAVRGRTLAESSMAQPPRLPPEAFAPPIVIADPVMRAAGGDVTVIDRWLDALRAEHVQRETWQWFAERDDWPMADLRRAWMLGQQWSAVYARALCKAAAAAHEQIAATPAPADAGAGVRRGPVWLGMPGGVFGGCECGGQSRHPRAIARCEWNERHGWRPRPSGQAGEEGLKW